MMQHVHLTSLGTPSTQRPQPKAIEREGDGKRRAWDRRRDRRKWADEWQRRTMQAGVQRRLILSLLLGWLYKGTGVGRGGTNFLRALHASPWRGSYSSHWSLRARTSVKWHLSTLVVCIWACSPVQWGPICLKRKQPLLPMGRKWFSHFSNADHFSFSHQMNFPRLPCTKTKTQKSSGEYLNPKIAKSHPAKHSPEGHGIWITAPLHPGALSHPAIFLFVWPLVISYCSEKSFIVVIFTNLWTVLWKKGSSSSC